MIKANLRRPTGFSDPAYHESEILIHGFTWGKHRDAAGYNRPGECALAIFSKEDGTMDSVPVHWASFKRRRNKRDE